MNCIWRPISFVLSEAILGSSQIRRSTHKSIGHELTADIIILSCWPQRPPAWWTRTERYIFQTYHLHPPKYHKRQWCSSVGWRWHIDFGCLSLARYKQWWVWLGKVYGLAMGGWGIIPVRCRVFSSTTTNRQQVPKPHRKLIPLIDVPKNTFHAMLGEAKKFQQPWVQFIILGNRQHKSFPLLG